MKNTGLEKGPPGLGKGWFGTFGRGRGEMPRAMSVLTRQKHRQMNGESRTERERDV